MKSLVQEHTEPSWMSPGYGVTRQSDGSGTRTPCQGVSLEPGLEAPHSGRGRRFSGPLVSIALTANPTWPSVARKQHECGLTTSAKRPPVGPGLPRPGSTVSAAQGSPADQIPLQRLPVRLRRIHPAVVDAQRRAAAFPAVEEVPHLLVIGLADFGHIHAHFVARFAVDENP